MAHPDPCVGCHYEKRGSCTQYKWCKKWLPLYMKRQKRINAYAQKVLPAYLARKEKEAQASG